ncbi:MAG: glycogen debranching protein, partial [Acidobacteriaceae bacterium]|nr:glycogen debranching protein [Acidobacteriaceae bacterium]
DTLWTTYAINSYGDFALTRRALDFLIKRQRADGKIMHEFSQSADAIDWKSTPYFYAAADSAPLLIMAMWDYVKISGDTNYLKANVETARKAYSFMQAHRSSDGIYNNTQGTGWVESWPQGMPYQEIYLATLHQQAAEAMSRLADVIGDSELSNTARKEASGIRDKIEAEYFDKTKQFYAFSLNGDGSKDNTASIYPAVAWWDGTLALKQAGPMLTRWASSEFSADWGTRDISNKTPFYDPISYHQGSIWPLFTGWVSLAEYRAGRPLSGYAHLMHNANLTWAQDLGSVTELLSGDFYQPLGRSSSHQMWSSAMVISPLLRGLFGLDWDALHHILRVAPQLPAEWDGAALKNVPLGNSSVDLSYQRQEGNLLVQAKGREAFCLQGPNELEAPCSSLAAGTHTLRLPLPPIELSIPAVAPEQGSTTGQLKVMNAKFGARQATVAFEGLGNTSFDLPIRLNRPHISAQGAEIRGGKLHLQLPDGNGYQSKTVTFTW